MYTFYGVTMIICVIAMIVGLFFYCIFQIFFWEDKNLYKLFCGLGLYIWFGFCFGSWLGMCCPLNWYAIVSVIAAALLFAQFCFFKKRWQKFYAMDRPLKKLKKAHVFAITALTLCFCGIYGYCNSQRTNYRQRHAEVYTVIGFNFTDSGYGFVPKMDIDKHIFVRLESSADYSQRVIMSERYHLGDTVRIFHNKII
jgi:hypothetical protein